MMLSIYDYPYVPLLAGLRCTEKFAILTQSTTCPHAKQNIAKEKGFWDPQMNLRRNVKNVNH